MKKALKKLIILACFGVFIAGAKCLVKRDEVQEKLLLILGDDCFMQLKDLTDILGDLLMWPVDFVRALLP